MNDPRTEPIEGKPAEGEQVAKPVSSEAAAQPSAVELAKQLEELSRQTASNQAVLRALQSEKDKRWEKEIKPMKADLARIAEALGVDEVKVKEAQRTIALNDLADAYLSDDEPQAEPSSGGTGGGKDHSAELQAIETALDLPANDARVTNLKLKYAGDVAAYATEAAKLKQELAKASPTPAEQLMPTGTAAKEAPKTDAELLAEIRGDNFNPFSEAYAKQKGGGVIFR